MIVNCFGVKGGRLGSLVLCWSLHWQIGRFLAPEDAIDIAGRAPEPVPKISSIRDQTAASDEQALGVDRGKSVAGRKLNDQTTLNVCQRTRRYDQTAITRTRERRTKQLRAAESLTTFQAAKSFWKSKYSERQLSCT
jgi:hypothetical protein